MKPAVSTTNASSGSFKKRFEKLLNYQMAHRSWTAYDSEIKKLSDEEFHYLERCDDSTKKYTKEVKVKINPATEAWSLQVYLDAKKYQDLSSDGWVKLIRTLNTYFNLPTVGTPDYNNLLTESCSIAEDLERIPEKLYHATYKQFLKSIQQKGLGSTRRKMWSDSKTGVVYLADNPWVAESYAETAEWPEEREDPDAYYENIIILEIDTSKLDHSKIKVDPNVLLDEGEENATWEYHGIIPWDVIKIFNSSSIAEDFRAYESLWD